MKEFYTENARDIEVYDQCDVLVVGSGCAGHSAPLPPLVRAAGILC